MRTVFVGTSAATLATARALIHRGDEVVIIENDKARIDELAEELDCSFMLGDGTRPDVLREVSPSQSDFLFCLTNNDHLNLIASLVGHSLGFSRVITRIEDPEFETICHELGLKDIIIPSRTLARSLEDMVAGSQNVEFSSILKDEARFFTFAVAEADCGTVDELALPDGARVICFYRKDQFVLAEPQLSLQVDDQVVILTHSRNLQLLEQRFPTQALTQHPKKVPAAG